MKYVARFFLAIIIVGIYVSGIVFKEAIMAKLSYTPIWLQLAYVVGTIIVLIPICIVAFPENEVKK